MSPIWFTCPLCDLLVRRGPLVDDKSVRPSVHLSLRPCFVPVIVFRPWFGPIGWFVSSSSISIFAETISLLSIRQASVRQPSYTFLYYPVSLFHRLQFGGRFFGCVLRPSVRRSVRLSDHERVKFLRNAIFRLNVNKMASEAWNYTMFQRHVHELTAYPRPMTNLCQTRYSSQTSDKSCRIVWRARSYFSE